LLEKPLQQTTDFDSIGGDLAEEATMREKTDVETMTAALDVGVTRSAQDTGMAALTPLHREVVSGLPRTADQEVRVLFATLLPGDVTPYHRHRFPVTVYMLEGTFTLELDDRDPVSIAPGQVYVEPAGVNMTGRNAGDVPARMALFYVCEPGTPFADPVPES
jgi:quercetin dioxygenase-like cupin family protein